MPNPSGTNLSATWHLVVDQLLPSYCRYWLVVLYWLSLSTFTWASSVTTLWFMFRWVPIRGVYWVLAEVDLVCFVVLAERFWMFTLSQLPCSMKEAWPGLRITIKEVLVYVWGFVCAIA